MSVIPPTALRLARDEHGFSMIEVLVSILTGLIVVFALFSILEVSMRQASRITDSVQADQLGRTALTKVVDELHTACMAREFAPVLVKSSEKELRFRTAYGETASIEGANATEHHIVWTGVWPGSGQLLDKTYRSTGGVAPNFTYEVTETPKTTVLAQNVYEAETTVEGKKVPVPIFQYDKYNTKSVSSTESALGTLLPISLKGKEATGLTEEEAKTVSAVLVTFTTAPTDNNVKLFRAAEFSNLVTFAFAAPASEATIEDGPCR